MPPYSLTTILSTTALLTTLSMHHARAANPVFGAYVTDSCDACLDTTYQSCPGYYQDVEYGICMCAGDGSTMVAQCLSSCDAGLNEPNNVVATWYGYCVIFFKDMCPAAQEYMFTDTYNEQCSPEAIAEGGLADVALAAESESGSGSGSGSSALESGSLATATGNGASANPLATGATATRSGSSSGSTSEGDASQTTSGAIALAAPMFAVMASLLLQQLMIVEGV